MIPRLLQRTLVTRSRMRCSLRVSGCLFVQVLDNTHPRNLERLSVLADECLREKARYYDPEAGHLVAMPQTNDERLQWFAEQLVRERRSRLGQPGELGEKSSNVDAAQAYGQ